MVDKHRHQVRMNIIVLAPGSELLISDGDCSHGGGCKLQCVVYYLNKTGSKKYQTWHTYYPTELHVVRYQ